ncbi:MAG: hypothetical protein GY781_00615 [Gammaproteobacteria bacterium]|nr:hypothetical protein [Gammaproteobacteria bacterium]
MIEDIFKISDHIRYVAIYRDGQLDKDSKPGTVGTSSSESDKYEELLVNPTLLKLATQRGNIDCGGLGHVLIRYGNFYQLIWPESWGHVSVCIELNADPLEIYNDIKVHIPLEMTNV